MLFAVACFCVTLILIVAKGKNFEEEEEEEVATMAMAVCVSRFHINFTKGSNSKVYCKAVSVQKQKKMGVPYDLQQGQSRIFHELPSGLRMEVIVQKGAEEKKSSSSRNAAEYCPPLVFVHGSYHAAWCWAQHWLPFFSSSGFDCYALSLLAQGESDAPPGSVAGTLQVLCLTASPFTS